MDKKRNIIIANMISNEINLGREAPLFHRTGMDKVRSALLLGLLDVGAPASVYVAAEGFSPVVQNVATVAMGVWAVAVSVKSWGEYTA